MGVDNNVTRDGIKLRFAPDTDGMGELEVIARSKGFAGRSTAWFNVDELQRFAAALAEYPLGGEARRGIASGYGATTRDLEEVHVELAAYQTSSRGAIGVRVRLATPIGTWSRPEQRHAVEMEIETTYGALAVFARQFSLLMTGGAEEAVLVADYAT